MKEGREGRGRFEATNVAVPDVCGLESERLREAKEERVESREAD